MKDKKEELNTRKFYRDFYQCKMEIQKAMMALIENLGDHDAALVFDLIDNTHMKFNFTSGFNPNVRTAIQQLSKLKQDPQLGAFSSKAISSLNSLFKFSRINISTLLQDPSKGKSILTSPMLMSMEFFSGVKDNLYGTYHTIMHPIETIQGVAQAISHPLTTLGALKDEIWERPVRFLGNYLTGIFVGKVFTFSSTAIAKKIQGVDGLTKAAGTAAQTKGEFKSRLVLGKAETGVPKLKGILDPKATSDSLLKQTPKVVSGGLGAILDPKGSGKTLDILKAQTSATTSNYFASLTTPAQGVAYTSALSEYLNAAKKANEATKKLETAAENADKVSKATSTAKAGENKVTMVKDIELNMAKKRKIFYGQIFERELFAYLQMFMQERLSSPEYWPQKPLYNLPHPRNLVFEGGGLKGIVHVGALEALMQAGIHLKKIERVGGASAGAIMALLVAVGYTTQEIKAHLSKLDLSILLDNELLRKNLFTFQEKLNQGISATEIVKSYLPMEDLQKYVDTQLKEHKGLFPGKKLREWLEERVVEKLCQYTKFFPTAKDARLATFGDLIKLQQEGHPVKALAVVGSDISTEVPHPKIISAETEPNALIVDAVKLSAAIPFFFYPDRIYIRQGNKRVPHPIQHLFIDGGCFMNYPVTIFDEARYVHGSLKKSSFPNHPEYNDETLGFRIEANLSLYEAFLEGCTIPERLPAEESTQKGVLPGWLSVINPYKELNTLAKTVLNVNNHLQLMKVITFDSQQLSIQLNEATWLRTIYSLPGHVGTLDFNLTAEEQDQLIKNGHIAVKAFLAKTTFKLEPSFHSSSSAAFFKKQSDANSSVTATPEPETHVRSKL